MKARKGGRFGKDRKVHAVDPDRHDTAPFSRTMCRLGISRRYTTANSSGSVNCEDCKRQVGRSIEATCRDSTTTGQMFDWSALLLPRGRRSL